MKPNITTTFLTLLLLFLLVSCAADPRNAADAQRTVTLAEQTAADQAQARAQDAIAFQQAQAERQATEQARVQALNFLIRWGGGMLTLAVCVALAGIGTGISWAAVGTGRAVARLAEVRASLIPLSAKTRQFPLVVQYIGQGRFTLSNPNTGSVVRLDTRRKEDRQLIAASGMVQAIGVLAQEAGKSKDAAGMAMIQPTVIGAIDEKEGLEVGTGLRSMLSKAQVLFHHEKGDGDE